MNFQELGLMLQRERESQGLTIEAVMEATKISRINLVALEKGDRSALPHPVYTKGFVKSYARLLGLDPDELSMVVDREYQSDVAEVEEVSYDVSPGAEKALQEADAPTASKRSIWPSLLIIVALGCAILLLVLNLNKSDVSDQPAEETKVEESQPVPEQPEPEVVESQDAIEPQSEQPAPETAEPPAVPAEPVPEPEKPEAAAAPAVQPEAPAVPQTEESSEATQEAVQYAHVLIIRATTDKGCWVGLWKGDEANMARDFVLKKGEPLRLMFNNPRRIRIGNVAGVEVTYNGKPYPLKDNKSNIQTLVFGQN